MVTLLLVDCGGIEMGDGDGEGSSVSYMYIYVEAKNRHTPIPQVPIGDEKWAAAGEGLGDTSSRERKVY